MDVLTLTVFGDPVPKGRPRASGQHIYTPRSTVEAEERIRALVRAAYGPAAPVAGPVGVDVTFYLATRRKIDGDNLLKLVTDALQRGRRPAGGVILDDAQIEEWRCRLFRRAAGQEPRTEIRVYELEPSAGEGPHRPCG